MKTALTEAQIASSKLEATTACQRRATRKPPQVLVPWTNLLTSLSAAVTCRCHKCISWISLWMSCISSKARRPCLRRVARNRAWMFIMIHRYRQQVVRGPLRCGNRWSKHWSRDAILRISASRWRSTKPKSYQTCPNCAYPLPSNSSSKRSVIIVKVWSLPKTNFSKSVCTWSAKFHLP